MKLLDFDGRAGYVAIAGSEGTYSLELAVLRDTQGKYDLSGAATSSVPVP